MNEVSKSAGQNHETLAYSKKVPQTTAGDERNNRNRRSNQVEVCGPEETRVLHLSGSTSASRALQCVRALFGDRPVLLRMCCDYFFPNAGGSGHVRERIEVQPWSWDRGVSKHTQRCCTDGNHAGNARSCDYFFHRRPSGEDVEE